ncbi:MAG: hypothetical protein HY815_22155 [Candidatus Riflebacteria bacterium]|nr:hypothetical protein [Candidatus Riflebacteria bacterium]
MPRPEPRLAVSGLPGRHLVTAFPYTVLAAPGSVTLVAGEDLRWTLTGAGIELWLPGLIATMDGSRTVGQVVESLDVRYRDDALELISSLRGERVLVDAPARSIHAPSAFGADLQGSGPVRRLLEEPLQGDRSARTPGNLVLCQDSLDFGEALRVNRAWRSGQREDGPATRPPAALIWATVGPMSRGYVSPAIIAGGGPCLECLVTHFRRLSPAPEIYDALIEHSSRGGVVGPVPFPDCAARVLAQIVIWKLQQVAREDPPAALYRLHVLELESMELSTHRVFVDPECGACQGAD